MMHNGCFIITAIITVIICTDVSLQEVTLVPTTVDVIENSSVVLTCSLTGDISAWNVNDNAVKWGLIYISTDGTCQASGFVSNSLLYSWNCHRNGSFTLTLIKVDRSQHGKIWMCRQGLNVKSEQVVINVKVPVEKIEVTKPSDSNVTIIENDYKMFICNTSYSRPTPSVQWFMQIGDETRQISTTISVKIISDNKGYTSTISMLNISVTRENQGAKIFCIGTNGLGSNVVSRNIKIHVFYAPKRGPYIDKAFNNGLYKLKENSNCNITCISVGGNPPPKLSWNCTGRPFEFESNEEVGLNLQWQAKRDEDRVCTCTSNHVVAGIHTAIIRIAILYPPTIESIKFEHTSLNQRSAVKNTIRVIENETYTLVCEAISKPEPSYKWAGLKNSNVSTVVIVNPQTRQNYSETCFATNVMHISDTEPETVTVSRHLSVEILYPPKINTMLEQRVKEGTVVKLTCPITPGNPAATSFKWTRASDNKRWFNESFTIHKVSRNDTMTYTCMANNTMAMTGNINKIGSSSKSTLLKVLYPPSIDSIKFEHSELTNRISVDTSIYVIENETYTLICEASSNPEPSYKWTGMKNSTVSTIVIVNPQTRRNYTETCHATNAMNFTNQIQETVNVNRSVTVEILYPPTINSMVDKRVIEGLGVEMKCPITQGNPILTSFSWTRELDNKRWFKNLLTIDKVSRNDSMIYTCIVNNTMVMTGNIKRIGTASKGVHMTVLYPPDKPTIILVSISKSDDVNLTVTDKLIVFEHTPFTMSCKANSLPMPSYSWDPITMSNYSVIQIPGLTRNGTDEITCFVRNTMISSEGNSMTGNNNRTVSIEKLFSPEIGHMNSITSEEGTNVDFVCPVKDGNPHQTHIMWTRNKDGQKWLGSKFTLENVSRTDSATYTCTVNNTMIMTGGLIKHGKNNKSINLNVLYKVAVLNFIANNYTANHSVTLAENQLVNLKCEIEGNPAPEGSIFSSEALDVTKSTYESHSIFSVIFKATCFHTGVYTCRGSNLIKQKEISERDITLFITCSPRQNPAMPLQRNIKISKYEAVSINFTVLAYPEPTNILLNKHNGKSWISMNDSDNYSFTYAGVDIQFTILRVSEEDYGEYKLIIRNDDGKFEHVFYIEPAGMEAPAPESSYPSVNYGLVAGLPVVIIIIITTVLVIGIILYRKRNTGAPDKLIYQNVPFTNRKFKAKQHYKPQQSVETYSEELQEIDDVPHYLSEPTEYYNSPEKIERIERIKVSELYSYVLEKSYESFGIDYEKLPSGLQKPCTFARKPENLPLNRYNGIYPYDHSRVKIPGCPDFFMNACYIDGYKRRNAYIASLGPTTKTTNDFQTFWQMVWHEETEVIVMLTNLNEPSGMKCEQYWPPGESCIDYGDISVKSKAIKVLAEYTIRTFHIIKDGRKRNLTHLHFTAWPDKTVPEDTTCLLEFRRRMKSIPTFYKGPIIVHCSAGIGRTGTLIAIDRLIEEGEDIGSVNVFECVEHMRSQRVKMVQTPEQYVYIYKALVNALVFGCETIPIGRFENYVTHNNDNFYSNQYKQLGKSVEKDKKEDADARAKNKIYNRQGADVPGLRFRVMLCLTRQCGDHDYVNAVYINTQLKKDHVIVAQTPLPNTIEDFISMIYNENCTCVVTMEDLQEPGMMIGQYVSENKHPKSYGNFTVACSRLETKTQYIVRQMKIKYNGRADSSEKVAYHFQYTKWILGQDTPVSAVEFLHFIEKVENYDNEFSDNYSHILVHCLKANERSGLFCAVKLLKEKIGEEREINVGNVLRHLRTRRQTAVTSMEQVKFCYQAVDAYIKMLK